MGDVQKGWTLEAAGCAATHPDARYEKNTTRYGVFAEEGLLVVARGMCGTTDPGADVAAPLIDALRSALSENAASPSAAIQLESGRMHRKTTEPHLGIGASLVMWRLKDEVVEIAHVGSCRVGRVRNHAFEWLTAADIYEDPTTGHKVVTKAMGQSENLAVQSLQEPIQSGDRYVLCSSGMLASSPDDEIVLSNMTGDVSQQARIWAKQIIAAGAHDVSCVIAHLRAVDQAKS